MLNIKVAKLDISLPIDETTLPEASVRYLLVYGATQSLNDKHANIQKKHFPGDPDGWLRAVRAAVTERFEQIVSGNVPGSGTDEVVTADVKKLAKGLAANGVNIGEIDPVALADYLKMRAENGLAA